jgi:hypothetical protein
VAVGDFSLPIPGDFSLPVISFSVIQLGFEYSGLLCPFFVLCFRCLFRFLIALDLTIQVQKRAISKKLKPSCSD